MKERFCTKSNCIILAAFFLPAVTIFAAYAELGFYPFGENSVLIMDMSDQYCEFFASLRSALNGENSLLFSWSRSMGGNFLGLYAYYLASPLSFLTLLFDVEHLPVALFLLTVLKTGLCGMTFAIYLEHGWDGRKGRWITIVFACCYALMSYAVVYGMCLMWLDGLILLPLILLGIEKMLQGQKGLFYLLALTASFICNYYTAYMIGLFSVLYLFYRVWCNYEKGHGKEIIKIFIRFAGNTLLAFGLSAPLILPTAKDLMSGKLTLESYIPEGVYDLEFWYLVRRLFGGAYDSITHGGSPSIFCGTLVVVLVVLFFFMRKFNWKEKLGAAIILLFLMISFISSGLNVAWHGFQYPTWFPHRHAFVFSTFLIILAYRTAISIELSIRARRRLPTVVMVYLTTIVLLFQYTEIYYNARVNITGLDGQFGYKTMSEYQQFLQTYQPLVNQVKAQDQGFYRMEKDAEFSKNDAMLLGYHGMTHYSSTFHAGVNAFTSKLGIAQAYIWNSGYGSSILTDSIFNVKYRIMEGKVPETYQKLEEKDGVAIYENTQVLPIAFASGKIDSITFSDNNFENQNLLLNQLAQTGNVKYFKPLQYSQTTEGRNWSYSLKPTDSNPIYLRMFGDIGAGMVYVNNKFIGSHFTSESNCNLYVGQFEPEQEVTVSCKSSVTKRDELIYQMDLEAFRSAYEDLAKGGLQVTKQKGSTIEGTIQVGKEQMIFTSIPYDEGFTVKVDGKEVKTNALELKENDKKLQTFLTIPADEGEHKIVISYTPPGFVAGICLAVLAVVVAVLYYRGSTWIKKRKKDE